MKDLKTYILENNSTQDEDLQAEIGLALQNFGSVKKGFNWAKLEDILDAMYNIGFDYAENEGEDDELIFYGEYIDTKYKVILYTKDNVNGKVKLFNFNVTQD